ncbi:MAG: protein translocase subunit SecF [Candidatus Magasanikbacteria bacterium CG11_big_fil_rev_8_21_14_0_20_39_34]|uniref:Protein-export membrane protein SecF n=1 Tax=Candidatus Magasanikbacteria bacterium CG11_big_fil_rev_8_21_14_0_20_39_34 TaxID=1974653 RepID=A0A2H0N532_9BACT|nr:MAG: protein translocase subunit SecF [Candidatus Magasanikbacteria bacterium CG11_big_fil_rev_8_21_14_0_20_39_34]
MIDVINNRKIPFWISGAFFVVSVALLLFVGLKPGMDFTGGSLIEVTFAEHRPTITEVQDALQSIDLGNVVVQPTNEMGMILKTRFVSEEEHQQILENLQKAFEVVGNDVPTEEQLTQEGYSGVVLTNKEGEEQTLVKDKDGNFISPEDLVTKNKITEERVETIGPAISSHLRTRAVKAVIIVMVVIILYVAYAFRRVSKPVSSWKYGMTAIIALIHDVVITMGVFVILGKYFDVEVDIPFIVALLTILGYSVNDTIVVFDRIRENLIRFGSNKFIENINKGINQTFVRSINTSLTTLVVLVALFLFGGDSIHYFSLALIIGILLGTYSSIFLASPLLVVWQNWSQKR